MEALGIFFAGGIGVLDQSGDLNIADIILGGGQTSLLLEVPSTLLLLLRVRKTLPWTRPVRRLQRKFREGAGGTVLTLAEQSAQLHALLVPQRWHSKPCNVLFSPRA